MNLTLHDVRRIAQLARIAITDEEARETLLQFQGIFSMIEQMQAIDTRNIVPMSHAQDVMLRLRDDLITEADQSAAFQGIAPHTAAGLYLVPKVIE